MVSAPEGGSPLASPQTPSSGGPDPESEPRPKAPRGAPHPDFQAAEQQACDFRAPGVPRGAVSDCVTLGLAASAATLGLGRPRSQGRLDYGFHTSLCSEIPRASRPLPPARGCPPGPSSGPRVPLLEVG